MQDIGGCRVVTQSVETVRKIVTRLEQPKPPYVLKDMDDYITHPKTSGYRGIHLIYRYDDLSSDYNRFAIELQVRSQNQHLWATTVEAVGMFTGQALKASKGAEDWLRFFALMGSAIAKMENCPHVPNTPTDEQELKAELRHYLEKLNVMFQLQRLGDALKITEMPDKAGARYYLLVFLPAKNELRVHAFEEDEFEEASFTYNNIEKEISESKGNAVLVSAESLAALRKAYPNYFVKTKSFIALIGRAIRQPPPWASVRS
jgi:hypothetical protein